MMTTTLWLRRGGKVSREKEIEESKEKTLKKLSEKKDL